MTLATKTSAVRHWLLREEWELRTQKLWTYEEFCPLIPTLAKICEVLEDGKFKSSLWWPWCPIVKVILRLDLSA